MVLAPFFCRTGTKKALKNIIMPLIPEHSTYTEPFVGGGAIFWNKEKALINVINDKDEVLIKGYNLIKNTTGEIKPLKGSLEEKIEYIQTPYKGNKELLRLLYMHCNSFNSKNTSLKLYKNTSGEQKLKKLDEYRNKLKDVEIKNLDYKSILKEYDGINTFHYLDPPYMSNSDKHIYRTGTISLLDFAAIVKTLKGKWLISLNDSEEVRKAFEGYKILSLTTGGFARKKGSAGYKKRKEVLIMNYEKNII
jgi:DNA adenine methylase